VTLSGFAIRGAKEQGDRSSLVRRYEEAERKWHSEHREWARRCGVNGFWDHYEELRRAKESYIALASDEKQQVDAYNANRRNHHLTTFLDTHLIRNAKIKGVGPAKEAALISFGIESAADIDLNRLMAVPGFGPVISQNLIQWRQSIERRFTYLGHMTDDDKREIARIRTGIVAKGATLRQLLLAGPQNLGRLVARVQAAAATEDPALNSANLARTIARIALEQHKIPIPSVSPSQTGPPVALQTSVAQTANIGGNPSCPKCGKVMIKRHARRGRFSGSSFWGCSRYPLCRGTRSF
jgi:hypothetical protein